MNRRKCGVFHQAKVAVGLTVAGLFALRGVAATWVGTAGSFTNAVNWDTLAVPTGLTATVSNGGTVRFDSGSAAVSTFSFGDTQGTSGFLEMTGGSLTSTLFYVGKGLSGTGSVTQTSGDIVENASVWADPAVGIGYGANAVGTYTMSGGSLTAKGGTFHVGSSGNGTFTQTGGAVTGTQWIVIGRNVGAVGTYTLSGGLLEQMGGGLVVGEQGSGTFNVNGSGVADLVYGLMLSGGMSALNYQGTGTVNLSVGGTINTPIIKKFFGSHATFNFDGGMLRVRGSGTIVTNFMEGLTEANVKSGGALIDAGNNSVMVNQSLLDGGGAGGLTKLGTGVLTLGGANAYAGNTVVSNGILVALTPGALPGYNQSGRVTVCNGAGLIVGVGGDGQWRPSDVNALVTCGAFGSGSAFGFDTTRTNAAVDTDLTGLGNHGLLKTGVNTLKLTAANGYTGRTVVNGGVLQADFGAGLPNTTNVTLCGGTLSTASGGLTLALGVGAGQVNIVSNSPAGFSAYGVPLTVNIGGTAGTLLWGSDVFSPNSLLLNEVGANQPLAFINGLDLAGGGRTINVNATDAGVTLVGNVTDSVGAGGLTKGGAGSLTLAGTNVYTGTTVVNAGSLTLPSTSSNNIGAVTVSNGGQLNVDGAVVYKPSGLLMVGDSGSGTLNMLGGSVYCTNIFYVGQQAGSSGTIKLTNGTLSCATLVVGRFGTGTVVQTGGRIGLSSGGGEWRFGDQVAGVGNYTLSDGTLDTGGRNFQIGGYGRSTMLQTGGILNSGGWMIVGRNIGGVGAYTLSGGVLTETGSGLVVGEQGTGTFTVNGTGTANFYNGLYLSGGSGPQGTGTVNLVTGGTINTPKVGLFNGYSATFNFDGGVLRARGSGATITNFMQGLTAANVKAGGAVIDASNNTVTVAQSLASGAVPDGGLIKLGSGSLILSGVNTYNGATAIYEGTLRLGTANAIPAGGAVIVSGGVYDLGGFTVTNGSVTLRSGSIINGSPNASSYNLTGSSSIDVPLGGNAVLIKSGTGTVTLAAQNNYTGETRIEGGTLKVNTTAAALAHRWSFNGSTSDSVGGRDATTVGAVTAGASQYTLAGGARGNSYISLGTNIFPTVNAPATIELWATQQSVQNFGRIFDFGSTHPNFLMMSWSVGTSINSDRVEVQRNGTSTKQDNSMAPYTLGTEFHIAMVITPGAGTDGRTLLQWYKLDAAGTTLKSGSMSTAWTLADMVQTNMWLGHSEWPDSDANASYDEVRIWNIALSQAQLAENSMLGPDMLPLLKDVLPLLKEEPVLPTGTCVVVSKDAVLDLGGSSQTVAGLSGNGVVSNGTLTVTGTIAPGGENVIGTLIIDASAVLTGTLLIEVATDGSRDRLQVQGDLDLTGLALEVQDVTQLNSKKQYLIATCAPGGLKGPFETTNLDANRWSVSYNNPRGEVRLISRGLLFMLR